MFGSALPLVYPLTNGMGVTVMAISPAGQIAGQLVVGWELKLSERTSLVLCKRNISSLRRQIWADFLADQLLPTVRSSQALHAVFYYKFMFRLKKQHYCSAL